MKKPTKRQKKAIDGIVFDGKSKFQAMKDAGYSHNCAKYPKHILGNAKGVREYLQTLNKTCVNRFSMTLENKVMQVYLDGLDAQQLTKYGEYPDHKVRLAFADRFARFFNWIENNNVNESQYKQTFNFFKISESEQKLFNSRFTIFLKEYYK